MMSGHDEFDAKALGDILLRAMRNVVGQATQNASTAPPLTNPATEFSTLEPPAFAPQEPTVPPQSVVPPLTPPDFSTVDMRRGFQSSDAGARDILYRQELAESQRYDTTLDSLHDVETQTSRAERSYRDTTYQLLTRALHDLTSDHRRLEALERSYEQSRETITDVNI